MKLILELGGHYRLVIYTESKFLHVISRMHRHNKLLDYNNKKYMDLTDLVKSSRVFTTKTLYTDSFKFNKLG